MEVASSGLAMFFRNGFTSIDIADPVNDPNPCVI